MPAPASQIDIEHSFGAETWTNRYLVSALPASGTSGLLISAIVAAHRAILFNTITVTRVRHATIAESDDDYTITPINLAGQRSITSNDMLPLFCTARVDFSTGLGRPSRKYLRGVLGEADYGLAGIGSTFITGFGAAYIAAILAEDEIVDPQGETFLTGSMSVPVQMRQLRRGSRRSTEPVLG